MLEGLDWLRNLLELLQHGVETSSTVLRLPRKYGYK